MTLPLDREEIQYLTEELELIIAAHLAWFKQISRALVCARGTPESELAADAYLNSPFGQWYYQSASHPLDEHPAFRDLGLIQQAMHEATRTALLESANGKPPHPDIHDRCLDLVVKLNNQLRKLQLELIGELLNTDPLTGCASRRGMLGLLREEQERAVRIQRPCSIAMMDFDHFKQINDEHGHPAGDAVLRQGMKYTLGLLRKYDSIYRYGGEEFLICLPGTPLNDAVAVTERIRNGLARLPIELPGGKHILVTASFGLSEIHPRLPVEDAIAKVDAALIQAKENGRNRVEIWQPG